MRKMWNLYLFTTLKEQRRGKPICAFFVDLLWKLFFTIVLEWLVMLYALEITS